MTAKDTKRYSLVLPGQLFEAIQELAEERQTTVLEIIKKFLRLGLLVADAEKSPDSEFIIRKGEREQRLLLV
ncbi:MAG: hypothetical protein AB7N91_29005 [Candidatus Tectimicrobiota bacterium]